METSINRPQTEAEKKDFESIIKNRNKPTAKDKFNSELAKHQQEAVKKALPFAEQAVRDDFNDYYTEQEKKVRREYGYFNVEAIKPLKIEWSKYSDLKNFELIEEGETYDREMSRKNPGININVKFKKYKFKGYSNIYRVQEDEASAVSRAKTKS